MAKYQSQIAERLHTAFDPDEECGRTDELGWAGLYIADNGKGIILQEDSLGFVYCWRYTDSGEMQMAWESKKSELDNDGPEPDEEDIVIQNVRGGYAVTPLGIVCESLDEAYMNIHVEMDTTHFYPNVWIVSDHGNFQQVTDLDEEVSRIIREQAEDPDN